METDFVPLGIPDAEVLLLRAFSLDVSYETLLARLVDETPWRSESVVLWGKRHAQPRLVQWYGDPGAAYTYSGTRYEPLEWTPLLLGLRERVEAACDARFNSVLLNHYRDGRDSMGMHSDDERELGPEPVIASLSFGATRAFVLRHRRDRARRHRLDLESGSLLVMRGPTQHFWQHGVPKQSRACGARVNLTFRAIVRE